jgi:hypothetical protein
VREALPTHEHFVPVIGAAVRRRCRGHVLNPRVLVRGAMTKRAVQFG